REPPANPTKMKYPLGGGREPPPERRAAAAAPDGDQRMVFGVMTRRAPT
ncbi:AraC family transcriptional regulator, partial [Klebsiella pneumoniae]|nr:AraC family transcriptional regulator [Klebsiella pneumoniae]